MNELKGIINTLSKGAEVLRETMRNQAFANEVPKKKKSKPISPKRLKIIKAVARLEETYRIQLLAQEDELPEDFVLWLADVATENREVVERLRNG